MICNVCEGTGFVNTHQIEEDNDLTVESVEAWMKKQTEEHDVAMCHCCGDGDNWYGEPGQHYGQDDPEGESGPYASNGGLCLCD